MSRARRPAPLRRRSGLFSTTRKPCLCGSFSTARHRCGVAAARAHRRLGHYSHVCRYTNEVRAVDDWLVEHASSADALGFDTETASPFAGRRLPTAGPHVLQLGKGNDALVVHLARGRSGTLSSKKLADVLRDPSIFKCGVGLDDDALELYRLDSRLAMRGRLDVGGRRGRRAVWKLAERACFSTLSSTF